MSTRIENRILEGLLAVSLIAALLLAGCNSTPSPTPTPTRTAVPAVVAVAPTDAPTAQPPPTEAPTAIDLPAAEPTATVASPTPTAVPEPPTPEPTLEATSAGPPTRLVIPDLKLDVPVVPMGWKVTETAKGPVSEWQIPENEAGHHINSVNLGEPGNLVMSGHNNIYGKVFEAISRAWNDDGRVRLDQFTDRSDVLNGRPLELYNAEGQRFEYQIEEFYRLRDTGVGQAQRVANARFMLPSDDTRVTVVTCWPPWNNTHRLVLIARPVTQP